MSDGWDEDQRERSNKIKNQLRTATQKDFQIVSDRDWNYPYAVSLHGCNDIACFKRKADAERFLATFPNRAPGEPTKAGGMRRES